MREPVRALLLAAGFGTRLRPLTMETPKCLITVGGKPILEYWLRSLEECKCEEVIVNTHYHSDQVINFLKNRRKTKMKVSCTYEPVLLGTAGTLLEQQSNFCDCTGLIIHSDNFTKFKLDDLIKAHQNRPKDCILTMVTFTSKEPEKCGVVETDENNIVRSFHEKVENPPGNKANGAIYAFDNRLIARIISLGTNITDLSTQVLPKLIGQIYTCHTEEPLIDIGTQDRLQKARRLADQKQ